jgi:hypothetical protein
VLLVEIELRDLRELFNTLDPAAEEHRAWRMCRYASPLSFSCILTR